MINIPSSVKNEYKDFNREIEVYGNLYLANKRKSRNLFNYNVYDNETNNLIKDKAINGFQIWGGEYNRNSGKKLKEFCPNLEVGKTYFLSGTSASTNAKYIYVGETWNYGTSKTITQNMLNTNVSFYGIYPAGTGNSWINISNIQIVEGTSGIEDYEPYGEYVIEYSKSNTTTNLFNIRNLINYGTSNLQICDDVISISNNTNAYLVGGHFRLMDLTGYEGKYITISYNMTNAYFELKRGTATSTNNSTMISWSITSPYTFLVPNDLGSNNYLWVSTIVSANSLCEISEMMVVEGQTPKQYERYKSSPFKLNEENEAKILAFNINEKADIYYTGLPYNTMTIEVDNEKGYFTYYDEDNILEQLNNECYVDLFMKINSGSYYKIMTMYFDKITYSDYTKAKLSFYSLVGALDKFGFKDKNGDLATGNTIRTYAGLKNYIENNYNFKLYSDHPDCTNTSTNIIFAPANNYINLKELILSSATYQLGELCHQGVLITSNYNNDLLYKAVSNNINENITSDLQIEKSIVKKEDTYKKVEYNYPNTTDYSLPSYEQTSETYSKGIRDVLNSSNDTLVIADDTYKLNDITSSDITFTGLTSCEYRTNARDKLICLVLEGNVGDQYDITITKQNIYKKTNYTLIKWPIGEASDNEKTLTIKENSAINSSMFVFLFIKKPIKSKVEIRIMGLPYLEIGDTLNLELENRNIKFVITEIETSYNDGLLQTIKGYELDWTHQVTGTYAEVYGDLNGWDL